MRPQLILNVAALSPKEVGHDSPHFSRLSEQGSMIPLVAPQPALTSTSHATMITGQLPKQHGIIVNGWYDQNYAKIYNWNRSDHLVQGENYGMLFINEIHNAKLLIYFGGSVPMLSVTLS